MMYRLLLTIVMGVSLLLMGCTPKLSSEFLTAEKTAERRVDAEKTNRGCRDIENHIPDPQYLDHYPMQYVRCVVHMMNSSDESNNYSGQEAIDWGESLIYACNQRNSKNTKLQIPPGNDYPVIPKLYRLKLVPDPDIPGHKGVYYHLDDEHYYYVNSGKNRNRSNRGIIKKYAINPDSILNIFVMPHHPDSAKSTKYKALEQGIALGTSLKISGQWAQKRKAWQMAPLACHEIGHVLGLGHTWNMNDGCDDTPRHNNCWNFSDTPPCDTFVSNNMMDYNATQIALSPCQIGKIRRDFNRESSRRRKLLVPRWCHLQEDQDIIITDSIHWKGERDLQGNLTIADGGHLRVSCRLSLPQNSKILVHPEATLVLDQCLLHNSCGLEWQGIEIQSLGKKQGKVQVIGDVIFENTPGFEAKD